MKAFLLTTVALLVLLVAAVYNAPASLIPVALAEVEARGLLGKGLPKLTLFNATGTVWQGEAANAELLIDGSVLTLGKLKWGLNLSSLLAKRPIIQISSEAATHNMRARVMATPQGQMTIDSMEGAFPLTLLEPWLPMLVQGNVTFVIDRLVFNQQRLLALDGISNFENIEWLGGEYNTPLGGYLAQFSLLENDGFENNKIKNNGLQNTELQNTEFQKSNPPNVHIQIDDFGAALGINGYARINQLGNYHINLALQPRESLATEVEQSISWLGQANADGEILIKQRGSW